MAHLLHFVVGFALLLHVLFWGTGGALLAMPRPWRRFWPVLIGPAGFALQSAVVWLGAHAGWRGTNSYAWPAEILPAVLLLVAVWRHGLRRAATDVSRFGLVWLQVAGCLALLILPLAIAAKGLTTFALSSCDAGDYAGGARTLMEFARTDRAGFLGLTEVVRGASGMSVDNFFDYWLRLNHFTPAALIAFNGTILDCAPHELTSLATMVLLAAALPVVFWIARAVLGYSGGVSLFVALLYGLSPITWYAVMQVAPAQLLAAQAIALLTWSGVALWRGRLSLRRAAQFAAVLALAYWLVLGSYNFILLVGLVPAVAYAGGLALWRGAWGRLLGWGAAMLAPLAICAVVFVGRVAGLAERFTLLRSYDFGWRIAPLTPEGWLGLVSGPAMEPWDAFGIRWLLMALVGVSFAWALWRAVDQRRSGAWMVASLMAPVLAGYVFLEVRGARLGTNASYDAYKLFAVFLPLLLPSACFWVTLRRSWRLTDWFGVVGLAGAVIAGNVVAVGMTVWRMAQPPLMVDFALRDVRQAEKRPEVKSVNVLLDHMWERLWANELLLQKPQYFATTTYEARWATPLQGEWDLRGGLIQFEPRAGDVLAVGPRYQLARTAAPGFVRVEFEQAWYPEERAGGERWRWLSAFGTFTVENPHPQPVKLVLTLEVRGVGERRYTLTGLRDAAHAHPPWVAIGPQRGRVTFPEIVVPPGKSQVTLETDGKIEPYPGDGRALGACVFGVTVAVRE